MAGKLRKLWRFIKLWLAKKHENWRKRMQALPSQGYHEPLIESTKPTKNTKLCVLWNLPDTTGITIYSVEKNDTLSTTEPKFTFVDITKVATNIFVNPLSDNREDLISGSKAKFIVTHTSLDEPITYTLKLLENCEGLLLVFNNTKIPTMPSVRRLLLPHGATSLIWCPNVAKIEDDFDEDAEHSCTRITLGSHDIHPSCFNDFISSLPGEWQDSFAVTLPLSESYRKIWLAYLQQLWLECRLPKIEATRLEMTHKDGTFYSYPEQYI